MANLNAQLSDYAMKLISMYIDFPDNQPITAVDFRARDGRLLQKLTDKHQGKTYLYGVEQDSYLTAEMRNSGLYEKVSTAHYRSESRISNEAFSLAIIDPIISNVVENELFDSVDTFVEPDFEKEERIRLKRQEALLNNDMIDFAEEDLTEEEKAAKQEAFDKKLAKSVKERKLAYRRALKEQEKRISLERTDNYLLARTTEYLMPGGILVMITPKEMIDTAITIRLANQYEDIRILRLEDEEYLNKRKCIILARKKSGKGIQDRTKGYLLAETKLTPYRELEEIAPQLAPSYMVPSQDVKAVELFRVGPLTADEILDSIRKSNLLESYQENYAQVLTEENPVTPTPLHKGHMMLLLTSGYLNGYIGKGPNQHLVKGTAIKMVRSSTERNAEGEETTKERDYYHMSVKYLNSNGEFHKLM